MNWNEAIQVATYERNTKGTQKGKGALVLYTAVDKLDPLQEVSSALQIAREAVTLPITICAAAFAAAFAAAAASPLLPTPLLPTPLHLPHPQPPLLLTLQLPPATPSTHPTPSARDQHPQRRHATHPGARRVPGGGAAPAFSSLAQVQGIIIGPGEWAGNSPRRC